MKKLTIVGMMVVACFTQAMESSSEEKKKTQGTKYKKTYSAAAQGKKSNKFTQDELAEIQGIMQLDKACRYTYRPKRKSLRDILQGVILEGHALTNFKIILNATGQCTILDEKGDLIGKYLSTPSASPLASLKKVQDLLAQQQKTSSIPAHILKRSQSTPNLIVAALSSQLEKQSAPTIEQSAQEEKYLIVRSKAKKHLPSTLAEGSAPSVASTSGSSTSSSSSPSLLQVSATPQPEQQQEVSAQQQQAKTRWWLW